MFSIIFEIFSQIKSYFGFSNETDAKPEEFDLEKRNFVESDQKAIKNNEIKPRLETKPIKQDAFRYSTNNMGRSFRFAKM